MGWERTEMTNFIESAKNVRIFKTGPILRKPTEQVFRKIEICLVIMDF